jgi:hypothetical protein
LNHHHHHHHHHHLRPRSATFTGPDSTDNNKNVTNVTDELKAEIESLLLLDASTLSKTRNAYKSAPDNRISSISAGSVAIAILVSGCALVVVNDLNNVYHCVDKRRAGAKKKTPREEAMMMLTTMRMTTITTMRITTMTTMVGKVR